MKSFAGITDSFWFEPSLLCVAGAGGAYAATNNSSNSGNQVTYTVAGCLVGFGIGYLINDHYEEKFGKIYQKEISDLKKTINEYQAAQAQRVLNSEDETIGLRVREVLPPVQNSDGSVSPATVRERLILPGAGARVGE